MALRAWASLARLDKLKLIPRNSRPFGCGVSFSLPNRRQPGYNGTTVPWRMRRRQRQPLLTMVASEMA